ncbi:WD40/YVTN/BNR-like repeat-containing protein [Halosimplex pelagicum]|uniref:Glycosyl hydrolase n=1 Tax=Halosimplex pelagicum TaxID=869886 RepID=A0A7D5P585_9EURY|nr:glycosyl hydrolase [Halosimplex pelagicum]QLH81186.1 glycosyl hydrolase [Halosimplex pelagicum]
MKLQGTHEGELYATDYRTLYARTDRERFRERGTLPRPVGGAAGVAFRVKAARPWKPLAERVVGRFPTVNVRRTGQDTLVASAVRWLYVSTDGGASWTVTHRLPESSGPMGVLPSAFCERNGTLYAGEYPLADDATPRVLRSIDGGVSWEPHLSLPGVRHVHAVEVDPYTGDLWVTTGDRGAECRIGRVRDGEFDPVGSGSQRWRAVQPVFTPDGLLWGVDSVFAESNALFVLPRTEFDRPDPTPRRVAEADGSVYYGASVTVDGDHWVAFSTAVEPGTDRTGPSGQQFDRRGTAAVVAASSATDYTEWHELAAYEKRAVPADRRPIRDTVPSASAYVFLSADDRSGLLINPYNTATGDGRLFRFSPRYFAAIDSSSRRRDATDPPSGAREITTP